LGLNFASPHDRDIIMILTSQEAQLSHRGSATLSVIEYFAKSLNII